METPVPPAILLAASSVKTRLTVKNVMMVMPLFPTANANVMDIMKNQVQMEVAKIVMCQDVLPAKKLLVACILLIALFARMREPTFKMVLAIVQQDCIWVEMATVRLVRLSVAKHAQTIQTKFVLTVLIKNTLWLIMGLVDANTTKNLIRTGLCQTSLENVATAM